MSGDSIFSINALEKVIPYGQVHEFHAGEDLTEKPMLAGKYLILISGRIELSCRDRENTGLTLSLLGQGDIMLETAARREEGATYRISGLESGKAIALSQEELIYLMKNVEGFPRAVLDTLSRRIREAYSKVSDSGKRENLYARLMTEEKRVRHSELAGNHQSVRQIRQFVAKCASGVEPVYLVGEKGTGKELVAWLIHLASPRSQRPFIVVESSDLADDELGERLFGSLHDFSRAGIPYRFGYLELARGGTILIKDIDLLSPLIQVRLAAFLEDNFLDVRFMATSREPLVSEILGENLEAEVFTGLLIAPLELPPLRERKRDLILIAETILNKLSKKYNRPAAALNREAQEKLLAYDFAQANVSELEEILERALVLADGQLITADHIFTGLVTDTSGASVDILQYGAVKGAVKKNYYPGLLQWVFTAGLWLFVIAAFIGGESIIGQLVLLSAWSLGWPLLLLSAAFAGRFTCSICPFAGTASIAQRIKNLQLPIPAFIKKYDYFLISFLFAAIFWIEEIVGMRHSPAATGILLLSIAAGAVIAALLYPRHTWCRHICPLGGMVSVLSMASPLELRSKVDICLHKCTSYNCYKGSEKRKGCPLFQHLSFVDNNVACKLCMNCVVNCPNDAVRLNIRPPAREIWRSRHFNRGLAVFILVFASMLLPIAAYEKLGLDIPQHMAGFSAAYWGTVLASALAGWVFIRTRLTGDESIPYVRIIFCLIPLVLGAHIAYQLQFVPLLSDLELYLHHLSGGAEKQLILITVLDLLRIVVLACGLLLTAVCLVKAGKEIKARKKRYLAAAAVFSLSYSGIILFLLAGQR